jgi:integrase
MTVGFLSRKISPTPLLESLKVCHPVASELIESGTPITVVRDQLRHSDIRITLGIYGHVIGNSQRNAVITTIQADQDRKLEAEREQRKNLHQRAA